MADIRRTRTAAETGGAAPWRILAALAIAYWLIASAVACYNYLAADQEQAHRLRDLSDKGLLTLAGKLDRTRLAALAADAAKNGACMDAHPPPPGQTGPWNPEECDPYLPREADADAADATWAASHPDSRAIAGWRAAGETLRLWAIGFAPLAVIALLIGWVLARLDQEPAS